MEFPEPEYPIPVGLAQRLAALVDSQHWSALMEYLSLHKQSCLEVNASLDITKGAEVLGLQAAMNKALITFIFGLETIPDLCRGVLTMHNQYLTGQKS